MDLRHEWKHEISDCDRLVLRQRLSAVMQLDPHAIDGKYFIRSLHFDNGTDKALREKLDGVNIRENSASAIITTIFPSSTWRKKASAAAWAARKRLP